MNCPKCDCKTKIIDTRKYSTMVIRVRKCIKCGYIFRTIENPETKYEKKK